MKSIIYSTFLTIQNEIQKYYPSLRISLSFDPDDDEYYISINDRDIFHSEQYRKLIFNITEALLWENGIYNVFFNIEMVEVINKILFTSNIKEGGEQYQASDNKSKIDLIEAQILNSSKVKCLQLAA